VSFWGFIHALHSHQGFVPRGRDKARPSRKGKNACLPLQSDDLRVVSKWSFGHNTDSFFHYLQAFHNLCKRKVMQVPKVAEVPNVSLSRFKTAVVDQRQLSDTGYELVLQRKELTFEAGRLLTIHGTDITEDRSYTIASGVDDPTLSVLYRLVPSGELTPKLVKLVPGDGLEISGSYGQFVLRDTTRPVYFIATGTGIAPCRAYVRTHRLSSLTILHGVRTAADLFFRDEFEPYHYIPCLSRESGAGYHGRVTDRLREMDLPSHAHYYLCGAYEMIYEAQALLLEQGVPPSHVFREGYYYKSDD